jgi:hypothetical protein
MSFTWTKEVAASALPFLIGHLVYGVVTAVVFLASNVAIAIGF